jgi:hypothetical protein
MHRSINKRAQKKKKKKIQKKITKYDLVYHFD